MKTKYTKQYFYEFFSKLKKQGKLGTGQLMKNDGKTPCCALGHLGVRFDRFADYRFTNKVVKEKVIALGRLLGVPKDQNDIDVHINCIIDANDHNKLLNNLE